MDITPPTHLESHHEKLTGPKPTVPAQWIPIPIGSLQPDAPPDSWIWEGVLAPGRITLLSAEAKAGKTTLLAMLYARMVTGGTLCGTPVKPGKAVVISEEPASIWCYRNADLGLTTNPEVTPIPFPTKPSRAIWEQFITFVAEHVTAHQTALVVFDTLSHLWHIEDENDNAKEATALMPLRQITKAGAALAIVHHFGAEKAGPRGGTELRAFPDIIVDLHLHTPGNFTDRRRVLKVRGRMFLPTEIIIRLNDDETAYEVIEGDLTKSIVKQTIWETLKTLVPSEPPGLAAGDFRDNWPTTQKKATENSILKALAANWEQAGWQQQGTATKGDAYRYWKPKTQEK